MQNLIPTKKSLSVRIKILLTVAVGVVGLSLLIYVISESLILKSYVQIEQAGMEKDLNRAVDAIQEFSDQQMIKLADWASWDEAYDYTEKRNEDWPPTSIYPASMANLDNNLAMFTNPDGSIFFIMVSDISERVEVSNESAKNYFTAHPELVSHTDLRSATQGIALLPEGPMIIVSLPVKNSEGEGPIHGALTFGRYLDTEKINALGEITHLTLSSYRYDAEDVPEEVATARERLTSGEKYVVDVMGQNALAGYALVRDIKGDPALILRVDEARPVFSQGNKTLIVFLWVGAVALLLFGIVIMVLLEKIVISRFVRLSSDVEKVNDVHDLSLRMQSSVKDEIGTLADKINQLLQWLSEAREAEASSRREIVNLLDELKKGKEQAEEMAAILAKQNEGK